MEVTPWKVFLGRYSLGGIHGEGIPWKVFLGSYSLEGIPWKVFLGRDNMANNVANKGWIDETLPLIAVWSAETAGVES